MKWFYTFVLALPMLSSCIGQGSSVTLPALGPVDRIEAKTTIPGRNASEDWRDVEKTILNPAQIGRIVALLDAQRGQFRDTPGTVQQSNRSIKFTLYFKNAEVREGTASSNGSTDEFGKVWNLTTFDSSGSGHWVQALVPDEQTEALVAEFGPFVAPKVAPKVTPEVAPKVVGGKDDKMKSRGRR